jgi:prepilin-type N-terminal cleavage/methylation domain-containing protein
MNNGNSRGRPGFTLVELMTVIAIIVLLIGILIPALSSARVQARKSSTAGLIKSVESGCEMFQGDFKQYPQSRGPNPFEDDSSVLLMGAQWLGLQLVGPDMRGIVNWKDLRNDSNNDGVIDQVDWNAWYSYLASDEREYTRLGPYASVDASAVQSLVTYPNVKSDIAPWPDELAAGTGNWSNERIPFLIDAFSNPVLYYRANPKVDAPFTTGTPGSSFVVGRYDQADNGYITGSPGNVGRYPTGQMDGWDLAGAGYMGDYAHDLGEFGYVENQTTFPDPKTFAAFFCDGNIFDNTVDSSGNGRLWPYKPDSYVLISAGEDGTYGTTDDLTNFRAGK